MKPKQSSTPVSVDGYWGVSPTDRWWLPEGHDAVRYEGVGQLYLIARADHAAEIVQRHNDAWRSRSMRSKPR